MSLLKPNAARVGDWASKAILATLMLILFAALSATPSSAASFEDALAGLAQKSYSAKGRAIKALAATGDARVLLVLQALGGKKLYRRKSDNAIFIIARKAATLKLSDPVTGKPAGTAPRTKFRRIRVNNRLRGMIRAVIGTLILSSRDPAQRLQAATAAFKARDVKALPALARAIAAETNDDVRLALREAKAATVIGSNAPRNEKLTAIETLARRADQTVMPLLRLSAGDKDSKVATAATEAIKIVERKLALWNVGQNIFYGISLGSVLLLAAIGLAITFGVMGVINMAHGEMVMLGAYTTFMVQGAVAAYAPSLFDFSLLFALPMAFLVAGAVGMVIERGVIRWLYDRPLETLLATWGISLILQQSIRTIFGPTNQEVSNPSWMSGAFQLGGLTITYNRLWIIFFAIFVLGALMALLRRTSFGLQMRAVTQNRKMAAAMGIRTGWLDSLTFGLGSGIAGIAGVALSQIDNVSPNLGQGYIIDSFMVVVFGGVGNLWGTLIAALSLGVTNKFLEPVAGAVLAKILVLVFIIIFLQKRPRGLFPQKGRAADA